MRTHHPHRGLVTLLLLAAAAATGGSAAGADSWVRVGAGGLGDPARGTPSALVAHADFVWVATSDELPGGQVRPRLFRAPFTADTRWEDATPPWAPSVNGEVTDLISFGGDLYVATSFGQIWRRRLGSGWSNVTPSWPGTPRVHALAAWQLAPGTNTLCAARGSVEVHCAVETRAPMRLPPVPLADRGTVGTAHMVGFRDRLFLAVGGESAGSRPCEVVSYRKSWSVATPDCFGDEERTWPGEMAVFRDRLYLGTGGHTVNGLYEVTYGGTVREAALPFYAFDQINRFPSAQVAVGRLFIGAHVATVPPGLAQVISTGDGAAWSESSLRGFAPDTFNSTPPAMASQGLLLYAGALNLVDGFEVWRRNHFVVETIDANVPGVRALLDDLRKQAVCLRITGRPCPSRVQLPARLATIKLGFDTARHPSDDAKLILATRQRFAKGEKELAAALALAAQADKLAFSNPAKAKVLYQQSASGLDRARQTIDAAWKAVIAGVKTPS